MNEMTDYLKKTAERALLKYTAGKYMFCPNCGEVLDLKTVIIIDAVKDKGTDHEQQEHLVACTKCYNPQPSEEKLAKLKEQNVEYEVTYYRK